MGGDNASKITQLEKTTEKQANTIAKLENEIKKLSDPNAEPRIIQRGNQKHPQYRKNKVRVAATLPKENLPTKQQ